MANLSPPPKLQFFDSNGNPLVGGKLYSYAAGTTTPLATYADSSGGAANPNPVILDSRGEANVWLSSPLYKLKLTTAVDVELWTVDNVGGVVTLAQLAAPGGAALIGYNPTGIISATTVQGAIDEVVSDLAASSGSSLVGFLQAGTGATPRTAQAKMRDTVSVKDFGAVGNGVADDTAEIQAAVDAVRAVGGGTILFPAGTYLVSSTIDLFQSSAVSLVIKGAGRDATTIRTTSDIVVFNHAEECVFEDFAITQAGTAKTGRAFSTPTNKQAAYCSYSRLTVNSFKYGIWWRYSLWSSLRDVIFDGCGVGVKLSRNALPNDQTNPAAPGGWNLDPGFFHNQNTFDNVVCNGGEVGIWGTVNGNVFNNVTCQVQSATGAANTVAPVGTPGVGIWLQNSGTGSSLFGANANTINSFYAEATQQPMVFEYCGVGLNGFYAQGSNSSGSPFEQIINAFGATVDARGGVASGSDYFKYQLVATNNATILGNVSVGSPTVMPFVLSTGAKYYSVGTTAGTNVYLAFTGAQTIDIFTMTAKHSYAVSVAGIYDGFLAVGCKFDVLHYQSGFTTILTQTGSTAFVTCTVSGDIMRITTTNPNGYGLFISVVDQSSLGNTGIF